MDLASNVPPRPNLGALITNICTLPNRLRTLFNYTGMPYTGPRTRPNFTRTLSNFTRTLSNCTRAPHNCTRKHYKYTRRKTKDTGELSKIIARKPRRASQIPMKLGIVPGFAKVFA